MLTEMNTKQLISCFCFDVWKQKQLIGLYSFLSEEPPCPQRVLYIEGALPKQIQVQNW